MKKYNLLLIVFFILFIKCKKDDDSEDKAKPIPVLTTQTANSINTNLYNLGELLRNTLEQNRQIQSTTTVTTNYEYDGRHISKATQNFDYGNNVVDVYENFFLL